MVFFNNEVLPKTAGKPTVYDFNGLQLDYETKTFKFPATIKVSEDEDFIETIKNGSTFASNTTYYAIKDGFAFEFKTKNLKLAKPNISSLTIDYHEEKVYFSDKYLVALDREFTNLVNSGDSVTPNMTLYVKRLAEGIYFESDVSVITLPDRAKAIQLDSAFVCSFGFVMTYYENVEYSIGDTWQSSIVFVGLENTTSLMSYGGKSECLWKEIETVDDVLTQINDIDDEKINEVINNIFAKERAIAIVKNIINY
jgi:hypothetical protein